MYKNSSQRQPCLHLLTADTNVLEWDFLSDFQPAKSTILQFSYKDVTKDRGELFTDYYRNKTFWGMIVLKDYYAPYVT